MATTSGDTPRPTPPVTAAAEALIVLASLVIPLAVVVAGVVGVRRHLARQRAVETRLARLEDATVDHHPG